MPIYEYKCSKCHNHFETMQKMADEPKAPCPKCGGMGKRLISQSSFALKGGGWYKDGYASTGKKPAGGSKDIKKAETKTPDKKEASKEPK